MLTRRSSLRRFLAYVWPYYGLIARATGAGMLEFVLPSTMALSLRFLTDRLVPAQAASPAPPSDVIAAAFDHYLAWFGGLLGPFWASPEGAFQRSLSELMKGRTSIVIAHRLSTIFAADRIIVLNDGRIVQIGSHAELSRRDGLYARLYEAQRLVPENDVATPEAPHGKAGAA